MIMKFSLISNLKLILKLIEKVAVFLFTDYFPFNNLHESFESVCKTYHSSETVLLRVHNDILRSIYNSESVRLILLHMCLQPWIFFIVGVRILYDFC